MLLKSLFYSRYTTGQILLSYWLIILSPCLSLFVLWVCAFKSVPVINVVWTDYFGFGAQVVEIFEVSVLSF